MAIVEKSTHVEDAQGNLISQFKEKPNFKALVKALVQEVREIEAAAFQVLNGTLDVANVSGVNIDVLGELVGAERGGRTDAEYLVLIRATILLNISSGTIEEILAIINAMTNNTNVFQITEYFPAYFEVFAEEPLDAGVGQEIGNLVARAKPVGVGGQFQYFETEPAFLLDTAGQGLDNGLLIGSVGF